MDWVRKLERKFGRYAITGLMNYVVAGQVFVYGVMLLVNQYFGGYITFSRSAILQGEVWRIITFIFYPATTSIFWFVFVAYFYYFIGQLLEHTWGKFRLNLYFFLGMLGAIIAGFLFGYTSNGALLTSLFLAYAMLYPEREVLVMFILPVKVKWLGWLAGAQWLFSFLLSGLAGKAALLLGMLGFILFFGQDFWNSGRAKIRREIWRHKNRKNWR